MRVRTGPLVFWTDYIKKYVEELNGDQGQKLSGSLVAANNYER